jgi:hypothetical protein
MLNPSTVCVVFSVTYYLELLKANFLLRIKFPPSWAIYVLWCQNNIFDLVWWKQFKHIYTKVL